MYYLLHILQFTLWCPLCLLRQACLNDKLPARTINNIMEHPMSASYKSSLSIVICMMYAAGSVHTQTVTYRPKLDELKYTFGQHAPVLMLKPGTTLETWTQDSYDGRVTKPTDVPSELIPPDHDNPETGPFYVEGAEPGDVLVIHILDLQPDKTYGFSSSFPFFGTLTGTEYTALLHDPLPEKLWWYEIDKVKGTVKYKALKGTHTVDIPMSPFLGCISVAPKRGEWRWTVTPEAYGGNMDNFNIKKGATVYLPVNVKGALLHIGDGHLVQGEGEIIGTAVEASLNVKLKVDVIKKRAIAWPRLENDDFIMAVGSYRPLEDAFRIAYKELILWMTEDYGMEMNDALQLASQAGQVDVVQVVDPNYTVAAKIAKKYLPNRQAFGGMHERIKK